MNEEVLGESFSSYSQQNQDTTIFIRLINLHKAAQWKENLSSKISDSTILKAIPNVTLAF